MDLQQEEPQPVRYRAVDLERLVEAHKVEYPKVEPWRMPRHRRADNRAWLQVDSPRGPVHRSLPARWKEPDPLTATLDDLEDSTARWLQLHWSASYSSFRWIYVPAEGWRDPWGEMMVPDYSGSELLLEHTPLGVLEFMRDVDAGVVAMGRLSDLDRVLVCP